MPKTFEHVILSAAKNLSSIQLNRENQREILRCVQNAMRIHANRLLRRAQFPLMRLSFRNLCHLRNLWIRPYVSHFSLRLCASVLESPSQSLHTFYRFGEWRSWKVIST